MNPAPCFFVGLLWPEADKRGAGPIRMRRRVSYSETGNASSGMCWAIGGAKSFASPRSDRGQTWLRPGSDQGQTRLRPGLAARLFANWIAYQSRGLRTIVEWLRTCHAVLRNEIALRCMANRRAATVDDAVAAASRADLLMVHTVDSARFAQFFHEREGA